MAWLLHTEHSLLLLRGWGQALQRRSPWSAVGWPLCDCFSLRGRHRPRSL